MPLEFCGCPRCEGVTQKGERCKREAAEKKGKESQIVSCCVKKILDSRSDAP